MTFFRVDGSVGHITPGGDPVFYVAGDIYDDWEPFDGLYSIQTDSGYISRIHADGSRKSWLVEAAHWSEVEFLAADDTGVYALVLVGRHVPGVESYVTPYTYLRKWDSEGSLLWSRSLGIASVPAGFIVWGGVVLFDGGYAGALDASDGSIIWTRTPGYGGWVGTGGVIRGPDIAGAPTMWTTRFSGVQYLILLGAGGVLGEWALSGSYAAVMPTSDPTVFYAWDSIGAAPGQLFRIEASGSSQPVEINTGLVFPEDTAISTSIDPDARYVFGHYPFSGGPVTPFGMNGVSWSDYMPGTTDYNGIFEFTNAHDALYMQVAWRTVAPAGVEVRVYDQETGAAAYGPWIFGGNESGGLLHGAFGITGGARSIPPETDNYISLSEPSQLTFAGIRWKFMLSHDWTGRSINDNAGTPVAQEDMIDNEDGYTRDGSWYQRAEESTVEGLEVHAGVDDMWWQLIALGFGRFLFTNGEASEEVVLTKGTWYEVEVLFTGGGQILNLSPDGGETLVVLNGSAAVTYGYSVAGASATAFHGGVLDVAFDEVTFDGVTVTIGGSPEFRESGWDEPTEGWNSETVSVVGGRFSIAATPTNGSVNVFSADGELLDYGTEWDEVDDNGAEFRLFGGRTDAAVTVVYFVARPILAAVPTPVRPVTEEVPLGNLTG